MNLTDDSNNDNNILLKLKETRLPDLLENIYAYEKYPISDKQTMYVL